MNYRSLGQSDLNISTVSFGAWGIGGAPFWSDVPDDTAIAAIRRAYDLGVNCFDTALVYGLGHSEMLVGKALHGIRDKVVIATKVGLRWRGTELRDIYNDLSAASIRFEIEESLRRLGTDYIDLYQVHWPDPATPIEETFAMLSEIQQEGKIRHIGVSNFSVSQLTEAQKYAKIVSVQPRYNLLNRSIEMELLPFCIENSIGVLPYSPLASGLLTGKYTKEATFTGDWRSKMGDNFKPDVFPKNIGVVDSLRPIAESAGITLTELAIAWVVSQNGITSALVGANSPEQVEENVHAPEIVLDEEVLGKILVAIH